MKNATERAQAEALAGKKAAREEKKAVTALRKAEIAARKAAREAESKIRVRFFVSGIRNVAGNIDNVNE